MLVEHSGEKFPPEIPMSRENTPEKNSHESLRLSLFRPPVRPRHSQPIRTPQTLDVALLRVLLMEIASPGGS
jgi:hypothetical protein